MEVDFPSVVSDPLLCEWWTLAYVHDVKTPDTGS